MKQYKVLCSVISLPGDPAYQGELVAEEKFNDAAHIARLIELGHIIEMEGDRMVGEPKQRRARPGPMPSGAASIGDVPRVTLVQAAVDLGIGNADQLTDAALKAAIAAAGR